MTTLEHRKFAREAVQRINEKKIIGDIVECGKFVQVCALLVLICCTYHILDILMYISSTPSFEFQVYGWEG